MLKVRRKPAVAPCEEKKTDAADCSVDKMNHDGM